MRPDVDPYIQKGMNKKPFVHPHLDSLTPADLRLRPLLGHFAPPVRSLRDFLATHLSEYSGLRWVPGRIRTDDIQNHNLTL